MSSTFGLASEFAVFELILPCKTAAMPWSQIGGRGYIRGRHNRVGIRRNALVFLSLSFAFMESWWTFVIRQHCNAQGFANHCV
mmetsp:Transcript_6972/g.42714  ORF Transcript_6972/g.42714 Transcript_6972/m.42714 type:complete len:83 (+) Transcript_6972:2323-2571(+)